MHADTGVVRHPESEAHDPSAAARYSKRPRRLLRVFNAALPVVAFLCCAASLASDKSDDDVTASIGQPIGEIIDAWRRRGVPFAYSTELISDDVVVREVPAAADPVETVRALLEPYGLTIVDVEDLLVVGRMADALPVDDTPPNRHPAPQPALSEVTVSASRYEILRELLDSPSFVSQRTIQQLPVLGEDPMRAVQRLPGNASSGASAKANFRGSEQNDTGLILNGQRLLDPFHVRDYQNLFSAIDSRAINGIEVFTGGFPVQYGDRIGGLVLIDTVTPDRERHTEIGLSVYNTSFLSAGTVADGDVEWLLSARRGNLDLVLNKDLGEPSYNDVFAEIGINFSDESKLSVNGLIASDHVVAVTESDPEELERSTNDTRNAQFWINWSQDWSEHLSSYTTLSTTSLVSDRFGSADDQEEIVARVDDRRDINVSGIRQDWSFDATERHRLTWGAEYRYLEGLFDYAGSFDYFGTFARINGIDLTLRRNLSREVDGDTFAVYVADRWQLARRTAAEVGIRWDKQTYTDTVDDEQVSPRISILHAINPDTDFRVSWGRYHQSQAINELQIEDGIVQFFPAQRADQFIASLQHRIDDSLSVRAEAYWKRMDRLRPRFENLLDPLSVMPELKPDRVRIEPSGARARGIEFSVNREGDRGLDWWATYSLSEVRDDIDGRFVPRSWDQRHALQLGLLWSRKRWDLAAAANAHSGWPKTQLRIDPDSDPGDPRLEFEARNSARFAPFATLDLRVSYRAPVSVGELSLFFELSNATNRRNPCCVDFELNDESGLPGLIQVDEYWFPLLPAIGLLWEF